MKILLLFVWLAGGGALANPRGKRETCDEVNNAYSSCLQKAHANYKEAMEAGDDGAPNFYSRKSCKYVQDTVVTCVDLLLGDCYSADEVDTMRSNRLDDVIAHLERAQEWDSNLCPSVKEYKDRLAAGDDDVTNTEEHQENAEGAGDADAVVVTDTEADADTDGESDQGTDDVDDGEPDQDTDGGDGEQDQDTDDGDDGEPDQDTDGGDGDKDAEPNGDGDTDADTDVDPATDVDDTDSDMIANNGTDVVDAAEASGEGEDPSAKSGNAYDDAADADEGSASGDDNEGEGDFDSSSTVGQLCGPVLVLLQLLVIKM